MQNREVIVQVNGERGTAGTNSCRTSRDCNEEDGSYSPTGRFVVPDWRSAPSSSDSHRSFFFGSDQGNAVRARTRHRTPPGGTVDDFRKFLHEPPSPEVRNIVRAFLLIRKALISTASASGACGCPKGRTKRNQSVAEGILHREMLTTTP